VRKNDTLIGNKINQAYYLAQRASHEKSIVEIDEKLSVLSWQEIEIKSAEDEEKSEKLLKFLYPE
jgi:hypothetical protein